MYEFILGMTWNLAKTQLLILANIPSGENAIFGTFN